MHKYFFSNGPITVFCIHLMRSWLHKPGWLVYVEVYVNMSAGTRYGKVSRKNRTAAKNDKMLPSASAQTSDIKIDSGDDSRYPPCLWTEER